MKRSGFSIHSVFVLLLSAISTAFILFAGGCSSSDSNQSGPSSNEYFEVEEGGTIVLAEQALGREFLLLVDMMEQENIQQFTALKSKVVKFEKSGESIVMSDVTGGKTVESSIPSKILLTEFSILNSAQGRYRIDFSKGISVMFVGNALYATDFSGLSYSQDNSTIRTNFCIVDSASAGTEMDLTVKIIAQAEVSETSRDGGSVAESSPTMAFTFHFIPYKTNTGFTPTLSPGQYQLGFFETSPLFGQHGDTLIYATKFDLAKKPVTYAISSNTPAEYREAVREGVLSWNTVMGEEIVAVIDAPEGVTAPDMKYNVIQWIDNINAGSAYANFSGDPRTGELLHAEIYLTSVFAIGGYANAWFYQKLFEERQLSGGPQSRLAFSLKGFEPQHLCNYDALRGVAELSERLIAEGASEEQCKLAAKDYVRQVVCHEVGHTLGLRHNFAGSMSMDYKGNDRLDVFKSYLSTGTCPADIVLSSSIMEYTDRIESVLLGAHIRAGVQTRKYDELAMKYLYKAGSVTGMPVFCTDSDRGNFMDCLTFDSGRSPVENLMEQMEQYMSEEYIPLYVFRQFIYAKSTRPGFISVDTSSVYLNYKTMAETVISPRYNLLSAFTASGLNVRTIKRDMPGKKLSEVASADLRSRTIADIDSDADSYIASNRHGITEVSGFFFTIPEDLDDSWKTGMDKILADPNMTSGLGPYGVPYVFSSSEIDAIRTAAYAYFENLKAELVSADLAALENRAIDVVTGDLGEGILEALYNSTHAYLLDVVTGETIAAHVNGTGGLVDVSLPVFAVPWTLRLKATGLLKSSRVAEQYNLWWGKTESGLAYNELSTTLDGVFTAAGKTFADVRTDMLNPALNSDEAQWWYRENEYIQTNFIAK